MPSGWQLVPIDMELHPLDRQRVLYDFVDMAFVKGRVTLASWQDLACDRPRRAQPTVGGTIRVVGERNVRSS